jgi:hypothetical protein
MTTANVGSLGLSLFDLSKLAWRGRWPFLVALLLGTLLAVTLEQRLNRPATLARSLDEWDIPTLVANLNRKGLGLRMVSVQKDGVILGEAFLTTTEQDWSDLNELPKLREQIHRWQGTLHCQRKMNEYGLSYQVDNWGDCCLEAGRFVFLGDRELLARVRAALSEVVASGDSAPAPTTRP